MERFSRKKTYALQNQLCEPYIGYYKDKECNNRSSDDINNKNFSVANFEPFIGLLCTFIHAVFTQIICVIVKKIWYVSVCQLALNRYIGVTVGSLPLAILYTDQILGEKGSRKLLLIRSILAATSIIFQITAYRFLQLVEASIVMATLPFVTTLTARIILKEPFGIIQTICLIITVCGVLLSIRLPELLLNYDNVHFDVFYLMGYAAAILTVLTGALSAVAMRKLKQNHFSVILLYTGFVGIVESVAVNASMFSFAAPDCGWDLFLYVMVGMFGFISLWMMTVAIQHEPAGMFAVQKSSFEILVTVVFQIIFFHKYPEYYAITGACLVIMTLITIGIKIWVQMLPETSERRKRFKWILS